MVVYNVWFTFMSAEKFEIVMDRSVHCTIRNIPKKMGCTQSAPVVTDISSSGSIPTADMVRCEDVTVRDPSEMNAQKTEESLEPEESTGSDISAGDRIVYFNEFEWSIGDVHEINVRGVLIKNCFTGEEREFKLDSQAIAKNTIDPNDPRDFDNKYLAFFNKTTNLKYNNYIRPATTLSQKEIDELGKLYRLGRSQSIPPDQFKVGKRIKLRITSRNGKVCRLSYTYGYIYGIGKDHVTIITDIHVFSKDSVVRFRIPRDHWGVVCEPDESDNEFRLFNNVTYNNHNHIIADISGDKVKLSGLDEYIPRSECKIMKSDKDFESLLEVDSKLYKLDDPLTP